MVVVHVVMGTGDAVSHGVEKLLVGGMGMRPLTGFQQAGVEVYFASRHPTVGAAVKAFLEGGLPPFSPDLTCKGHAHAHEDGHCVSAARGAL